MLPSSYTQRFHVDSALLGKVKPFTHYYWWPTNVKAAELTTRGVTPRGKDSGWDWVTALPSKATSVVEFSKQVRDVSKFRHFQALIS